MEIVTKIAPICLAIIMFSLGLGLTINDFLRVIKYPKNFSCRIYMPSYFATYNCFYINKFNNFNS